MDDTTSALFEFSKNCTGNLTTIFACPYTTTFNVFGTNIKQAKKYVNAINE